MAPYIKLASVPITVFAHDCFYSDTWMERCWSPHLTNLQACTEDRLLQ